MKKSLAVLGILAIAAAAAPPSGAQSAAADPSFIRWRNIGPATIAGRVSAIDALNNDFRVVLVGAASGGVFKSVNAGMTWEPIFDRYGAGSVGDVAFFQPDPKIIWVGTGEANNRNPTGWGDGLYKSTDGGRTFARVGLETTYHIARIVTHPTDPDIVYVAAIGCLWAYTGDRGLFKTVDGGKTWRKLAGGLPDDGGKTGCTELVMDPTNPETLYCGMYHRIRTPYSITSGGPNGGIFKSVDGGETWRKLTKGLPTGETGRIGLSIFRKDPRIVVACVEADENLPRDMSIPGPGIYRSDDAGETWTYIQRHASRPFYHSQIRIHPLNSDIIYVPHREFIMSTDGGKTFGPGFRGVFGDPHAMWIDPVGGDTMYFGDDGGAHLSHDRGANWTKFDNMALGQYYAIGVDMREPYWVYGGMQDNSTWGIPSRSRDRLGILNDHGFQVSGGDGFRAQVDPTDWRTIYTTAHGGVLGRSNLETREHWGITPSSRTTFNVKEHEKSGYTPFRFITGQPATEVSLWPDVPDRRIDGFFLPANFRFTWNVPVMLSPHDPRTVFFGMNHLFKSTDRGDSWTIISPDLTMDDPVKRDAWATSGGLTRDISSAECFSAITTIGPSPRHERTIWVGTDDGNVQVTRDGGATWMNVRPNMRGVPAETWVSCVEASHFLEGRAYVSLDGHRTGDFKPYLFRTDDYGRTWTPLTSGIPGAEPVYVVREDFKNPDLLFAGTEFAVYISIDGGRRWSRFMNGLPTVPVFDLVIHPRDADLVAGTHGRSIWIADDITPLQQFSPEIAAKDIHLFESRPAVQWLDISRGGQRGMFYFAGENPQPGPSVDFHLKAAPQGPVTLVFSNAAGDIIRTATMDARAGFNRFHWDMRGDPPSLPAEIARRRRRPPQGPPASPGTYKVTLTADGRSVWGTVVIHEDPLKR